MPLAAEGTALGGEAGREELAVIENSNFVALQEKKVYPPKS